jgi:HSP20 family protein
MMNTLALRILPFRRPETFHGNINELFGPFFNDWERVGMPERSAPTGYVPQIASYVEGSMLCLKVDLPGVEPTEIELTVEENQLTLSGERKAAPERQRESLPAGVRYGPFSPDLHLARRGEGGRVAGALHQRGPRDHGATASRSVAKENTGADCPERK